MQCYTELTPSVVKKISRDFIIRSQLIAFLVRLEIVAILSSVLVRASWEGSKLAKPTVVE